MKKYPYVQESINEQKRPVSHRLSAASVRFQNFIRLGDCPGRCIILFRRFCRRRLPDPEGYSSSH